MAANAAEAQRLVRLAAERQLLLMEGLPPRRLAAAPRRLTATPPPTSTPGVAVCVSGLPSRLLPESVVEHLVVPNANVWSFDLIYALSAGQLWYAKGSTYAPSKFGALHSGELRRALEAISPRTHRVHVLEGIPARNMSEWVRFLGVPMGTRLNRIRAYETIQHRLLNMFVDHRTRKTLCRVATDLLVSKTLWTGTTIKYSVR